MPEKIFNLYLDPYLITFKSTGTKIGCHEFTFDELTTLNERKIKVIECAEDFDRATIWWMKNKDMIISMSKTMSNSVK